MDAAALVIKRVVALYDFQAREPGELSFREGDIIDVVQAEDEWWVGWLGNASGEFPCNYVEQILVPTAHHSSSEVGDSLAACTLSALCDTRIMGDALVPARSMRVIFRPTGP